jgi:dTDP-4-amino-4,6-dideoxygalactose transaminase
VIKKIKRLDLSKQWISQEKKILPSILKVLRSGQYVNSDIVKKLENKIARLNNTKYCICTNSGTDALTLGLHALGIKKNDEVITQSNSFIASAASIVHLGAKPVFVDIKNNQMIDEDKIQLKITKKTKAIMPVHLTGRMANMKIIKKIAKKNNLKIIEDCAQAIGSKYSGKYSGTYGDIGCFSAHPLKNLNACGDGGFVILNDKKKYEYIKKLTNHGLIDRNLCETFGYVSRMDAIQASILNERIKYLKSVIKKRRFIAKLYFEKLQKLPIDLPLEEKFEFNTYHLFVIRTKKREKLIKYLRLKGIETGIHYPIPIHKQQAYKNLFKNSLELNRTEKQAKEILSLPINEFLKKNEIIYTCNMIKAFFNEN